MIEDKFGSKVEPGDPNRCQASSPRGQCPYGARPGDKYCVRHAGNGPSPAVEKSLRAYRLARWQNRVDEFAEHDQVKSLREEVGITRMLLEAIILKCNDENDLLLYSGKIADLVTRIEKLVSSCHRLEASTGMLLDKTAAIHLAGVIVEIIGQFVTDEDAIDNIANEIIVAILSHKTEVKKLQTPS